jgi:hypothetical protein
LGWGVAPGASVSRTTSLLRIVTGTVRGASALHLDEAVQFRRVGRERVQLAQLRVVGAEARAPHLQPVVARRQVAQHQLQRACLARQDPDALVASTMTWNTRSWPSSSSALTCARKPRAMPEAAPVKRMSRRIGERATAAQR